MGKTAITKDKHILCSIIKEPEFDNKLTIVLNRKLKIHLQVENTALNTQALATGRMTKV